MQMKFDMIGLFVTDMGRMARFYREALGFEIKEGGMDESPYTEMTGAGIRFSMYKRAFLPALLGKEPGYPQGLNGTLELAVNVGAKENVDKVFAEIVAKGGMPVYEPRDEPWKMRSAMVADPEGNLIEIGSDFWN